MTKKDVEETATPVEKKSKAKAKPKAKVAKKEKVVKPKKPKNYLNNKDMLAELRRCHEAGEMTNEFAKMIQLLADRYGSRYEYSDYHGHIEDMKAVAVMNVVRAWKSFDPEKSNNPFAYFTQAVKHTFWQYVSQEKKHRLNRDHLLIDRGELPSDAFLEDYSKEIANAKKLERLTEVLTDKIGHKPSSQYIEDYLEEIGGIDKFNENPEDEFMGHTFGRGINTNNDFE